MLDAPRICFIALKSIMANKTLNTRQKQVFRAPAQVPLAKRGQQRDPKTQRPGAPAPKPPRSSG
jgi:hypothetical protein